MENQIFKLNEAVKLVKINKYLEDEGLKIGDVGIIAIEGERNGYILVIFDGFIYENPDGEWICAVRDTDVGVPVDYVVPATDQELADYFKRVRAKWRETASEEEIRALDAFDKKYGH